MFVIEHPLPALRPHIKVAPMAYLRRDNEAFVGRGNDIPGGIGAGRSTGEVGKSKRHKHGFGDQARKIGSIEIRHLTGNGADFGVGAMGIEIVRPSAGTPMQIGFLVG